MKNNKKGFTLAELLIVVAIIAVLVAISIPVFGAQLEKSREATDLANIRSAYAEAAVKAIETGSTGTATTVPMTQEAGWTKISGTINNTSVLSVGKDDVVTVTVYDDGSCSFSKN